MVIHTGLGYDIHRLCPGEGMKILGTFIPCPYKVVSHSDGDLGFHALSNAILSAVGLEDIGTYFSDKAIETAGMDSGKILLSAVRMAKERGYKVVNVVVDIIAEAPRLEGYKKQMKENLSRILSLDVDAVSVHANTKEKTGAVGKKEAIECLSSVLVSKD